MKHRLVEESRLRIRRQKSNLVFDSDGEGDSGSSCSLGGYSYTGETSDSSSCVHSFYSKSSSQESTKENDETVKCTPGRRQRYRAQRSDSSIFLQSYGNEVSPFFSSPYNALMLTFISIISIVAFATLISEMKEEYERTVHPHHP